MDAASATVKKRYVAAQGSRLGHADAVLIGRILDRIEAKHGRLTPELVVAQARAATSPLHRFFEWRDRQAAEAYRLEQARYLIRSVRVVVESRGEEIQTRAFVLVHDAEQRTYTNTLRAMSEETYRRQVLERALKELLEWRERYKHLEELAEVFVAVERVAGQHR